MIGTIASRRTPSHGFRVVETLLFNPQKEDPTEAWTELKKAVCPEPWQVFFLWRPKKSNVEKGDVEYYGWEEF